MAEKLYRIVYLVVVLLLPAAIANGQTATNGEDNNASIKSKANSLGIVWGACMQKNYGEQSKVLSDLDRAWEKALKLCEPKETTMRRFFISSGATSAQADQVVQKMIEETHKVRSEVLKAYNQKHK